MTVFYGTLILNKEKKKLGLLKIRGYGKCIHLQLAIAGLQQRFKNVISFPRL